ncbi:cache domain-containing sensor histidine kinase [Cellulosilyticum sp. I15G10I2]|uniref:cache domain-containing sensor histidine kinase n=1 Tax=Cellulosilyticum sp. I15G10I2 TaxID=1892843 RepID=UPI00085C4E07|nr:sensor histidine kinase [Cellulosilyticum sp. I15G10I2]
MAKSNRQDKISKLKSIKSLMIIYFTTIIVIGMLFTGVSLYEKFSSTSEAYASKAVDQLLTQVKYSLDTYTRNMMNVSNTLYYKIIKKQNIASNNFASEMNVIQTTNNDIASLVLFKSNGELIANSQYAKLKEGIDVTQQKWFQNSLNRPENIHFSSPHKQDLFEGHDQWVISLSRAVSLNENGRIIQGVLLVDMNMKGIENICGAISEDDVGSISILSSSGSMIYGDENQIGLYDEQLAYWEDGNYTRRIDGKRLLVTVKTAGYTGWKIVATWRLDKILFTYTELNRFLIIVLMIGIVMCVIGTLFISSRLSSPLYKLQKSMNLVEEGRFDIQIDESGEYIVSHLAKSFNAMVSRIKELMHEIVIEQDDKRKKELEALQSQINPHFLYNTLDSIIWLAESDKIEEAIMMITALSRFFRIGISSGRNIITVREELEHARNYLAIQKIRYKNKFEFNIKTDEEALNAKTLKLILQPLIENALYHGIEYILEKGEINISVKVDADKLIYEISDNGIGMSEETRLKLFDKEQEIKTKGSGVGVKNVNERIKLYYGQDYGMQVESKLEEGTTIYIKIPLTYT